ncbi:MAG: hypothetical protein ISR58_16000 [Anaerolineales bacterium]|nr:hypothetical protein [Chloroflexota bacterium]MBL6982677.1 hypothetical protein [Anaerolineales bacterium]
MTTTNQPTPSNDWKTKILIIGAIIGALTGLGTAYLLIQRADEEEGLKMSAGEGAKLGVSVFSFLRQISQM